MAALSRDGQLYSDASEVVQASQTGLDCSVYDQSDSMKHVGSQQGFYGSSEPFSCDEVPFDTQKEQGEFLRPSPKFWQNRLFKQSLLGILIVAVIGLVVGLSVGLTVGNDS